MDENIMSLNKNVPSFTDAIKFHVDDDFTKIQLYLGHLLSFIDLRAQPFCCRYYSIAYDNCL